MFYTHTLTHISQFYRNGILPFIARHRTVLSFMCDYAFRPSSFHFNCLIVFCHLSGSLLMGIELVSNFIANKNSAAETSFVNVPL